MSQPTPPGPGFPPPGGTPSEPTGAPEPYPTAPTPAGGWGTPGWPAGGPAPVVREQLPRRLDGQSYPELHALGHGSWWRSLVGMFLIGSIGLVTVPVLLGFLVMIWGIVVDGRSVEDAADWIGVLLEGDPLTPLSLALLLGSLAGTIPVVFAVQRMLHGLRPGWLNSVVGRMRWRYLAACLGLSVVAMGVTMFLSVVLPSTGNGADEAAANAFTETTRNFLLVIVLLVPFQAAAEEYLFRGYLMQAWGGMFGSHTASKVVAVVGSAVVFALMHGAQEAPIFIDRLTFGLLAGVLVLVTGGLEAAIALHVVNNVVAFGFALFFDDITAAMTPSGSTWWQVPVTLVQAALYLAMAWWLARRMGLRNVTSWPPREPVLAP